MIHQTTINDKDIILYDPPFKEELLHTTAIAYWSTKVGQAVWGVKYFNIIIREIIIKGTFFNREEDREFVKGMKIDQLKQIETEKEQFKDYWTMDNKMAFNEGKIIPTRLVVYFTHKHLILK